MYDIRQYISYIVEDLNTHNHLINLLHLESKINELPHVSKLSPCRQQRGSKGN